MTFPTITSPPQAQAEVVLNEALETLDHVSVFGKRHAATTGLTWAHYGGRWGGISISNGTVTLTGSTTNYVVVARATGTVSTSTSTTNWLNLSTYARLYKITTATSTVSAVEDHRAGPAGAHGPYPLMVWVAVSDESTALTTGTGKLTFRLPMAMTVTEVRGSLSTAQTSGSIFTVDINEGGSTILSTKLTLDNTEKTSTTAATPPVISDTALALDAEITIDIDQVGDGTAKGLKVLLLGF